MLRLGHKQKGRKERIAAIQDELSPRWAGSASRFARYAWPAARQLLARRAGRGAGAQCPADRRASTATRAGRPCRDLRSRPERGATLVSVYAKDQPGLFYRLAGAISLAGGNIIDARIHTTDDGMALDNFLVQDMAPRARSPSRTS